METLYNFDSVTDLVKYRAREAVQIHENVRVNIANNTATRNHYRNLFRKDKNLQIGDRVLLRNHAKKHKLELTWIGPGKIMEIKRNA